VTLEDILDLYDRLLLNKDTIKRFTVHVSSQKHNKLEPQQQQERGGGGGLEVSVEATTTSTSANKVEEEEDDDDDDDAIPLCREDWKAWNKSMPLLPGVIHLERAKN
jgi:hypothetical protein